MKIETLEIDTLQSVGVTQIIPEEWEHFIWTALSDGAPFSWGDNNHSLVDAHSFFDHLDSVLDYHEDDYGDIIKEYRPAIVDTLNYLQNKNIYIDLEE